MERTFCDFKFVHINRIAPDLDENNVTRVYFPQSQYRKQAEYKLHDYGEGPFCRFRIPKHFSGEGVYILTVDNEPFYVGKCQHLSRRYNTGYGQISPRNCYRGGQSTNCRLNNSIYQAVIQNQSVDLWFLETSNRSEIESILIQKLGTRQRWNRKD